MFVTVRVINSQGNPEYAAKVSIGYGSVIFGGVTPDQRTGTDGETEFEINASTSDRIKIYANGNTVYEDYAKPKITVHLR